MLLKEFIKKTVHEVCSSTQETSYRHTLKIDFDIGIQPMDVDGEIQLHINDKSNTRIKLTVQIEAPND